MAKAKITTSSGTVITIDGTASEVKEIITVVKQKEDSPLKKVMSKKQREEKKTNTATDVILSFRESGYFNKPKKLLEIKKALEEQGMIYPVTTLSPILLKLVRKRLLGRIKEDKKWCYVKRWGAKIMKATIYIIDDRGKAYQGTLILDKQRAKPRAQNQVSRAKKLTKVSPSTAIDQRQ